VSTAVIISGAAGAKEMMFSSYLPPKHLVNAYGIEPMFKEFGPEVPWKLVTGGQLFSAQNTLKGIGNRTADGGGPIVLTYTRAELKHTNIMADLMMLGRDEFSMTGAVLEAILKDCAECKEDYARNNVVLMSAYGVGGYALLCNKQVTNAAEAKGKKIRTTGPMGRWARALGGTPVNMTSGEMVEAVQRGQVDCIMGPVAWLKAYSMEDSIKYIWNYSLGSLSGVSLFTLNKAAWNEHSDAQKKKIFAAQAAGVARTMVIGYAGDDERSRKIAKQKNITISEGGDDVRKIWTEHKAKEVDVTIQNAEKLGIKNGRQLVENFQKSLAKWEGIIDQSGLRKAIAEAGDDEVKLTAATKIYERLVTEHIYSKLDHTKF